VPITTAKVNTIVSQSIGRNNGDTFAGGGGVGVRLESAGAVAAFAGGVIFFGAGGLFP
jgi:hypothetical protein